ncbi:MAG: hypothetical protein ACLR9X_04725 [Clostridia bacterium]
MCCNKPIILIVSLLILFIIVNIFLFCFCITSYKQPNILQALNSQIQVGNSFTPLVLDTNKIQVGNAISHDNSSPEIIISQSGIYLVNYSVTGSLETGGPPTFFEVLLNQNNTLVPNSTLSSLVVPSGQLNTLSGSTIIEVSDSSVISLVGNSSSDIIYQDVSISVIKID